MATNVLILGERSRRVVIGLLRLYRDSKDVHFFFARQTDTLTLRLFLRPFSNVTVVDITQNNDKQLIEELIELANRIGGFQILPIDELNLRLILEHRSELQQHGIALRSAPLSDYLKLSEKESFVSLCQSYHIATPAAIDFPVSFDQPFVIKPQRQIQQEGVLFYPYLVENKRAYNQLLKQKVNVNLHFCQQYIIGPSIYYSAVYKHGVKEICFTQINTHQQPNGKSIIKSHPGKIPNELMTKIDCLFADLKWDGVMMFELKLELNTLTYYAIECNPRLWGPNHICIDNGYDFFSPLLHLPVKTIPLKKPNYGFLWLNGFLSGFFIAWLTNTKFQIFNTSSEEIKIRYRSIWLRTDTWPLFFLEPISILIEFIPKIFKQIFKIK